MGNTIKAKLQVEGADQAVQDLQRVTEAQDRLTKSLAKRADQLRKLGVDEATLNTDPVIRQYESRLDVMAKGADGVEKRTKDAAKGTEALVGLIGQMPKIADALGLEDLSKVASQLELVGGLVTGIEAAVAAFGGLAVGLGAALVVPLAYCADKLMEISRLNRESLEMTNGAVKKGGDSIERTLASREESGEISREQAKDLRAQLQKLRHDQIAPIPMRPATEAEKAQIVRAVASGGMSGARPDVSNLQVPVMTEEEKVEDLRKRTLALSKATEAVTGPSRATIETGQLDHLSAMAAHDDGAAQLERLKATDTMEAVLRIRTSGQEQQLGAVKKWNDTLKGLLTRQAEDELAILNQKIVFEDQHRDRIPENDKDGKAKSEQELDRLENQKTQVQSNLELQKAQQDHAAAERQATIENNAKDRAAAEQDTKDKKEKAVAEAEAAKTKAAKDKATADASSLRDAAHAQDSNRETLAATQTSRDEQDPTLSRLERVARLRADYDAQLAAMRQSASTYEDDNKDATDLKKAQNQDKILGIERKQLDVRQKLAALDRDNTFTGKLSANLQQLSDQWSNLGAKAADFFTTTFSGAVTSVSQATASSIVHAKNLGQALANVGLTIEEQLLTAVIQLPVQWLLSHTLMAGISRLFNAGEVAGHAAAETVKTGTTAVAAGTRTVIRTGETVHHAALTGTQVGVHAAGETAKTGSTFFGALGRGAIRVGETIFHGVQSALMLGFHIAAEAGKTAATVVGTAIRIPLVLGEVLAHIALGAIEAFSAVASIPYVGPFLGIALIGTVLALGAQLIAKGFADGGMVRGPGSGTSDSIATRLSDGEHVTRAASVSRLGERFMAGINAGVVDLSALNPGATLSGARSAERGAWSGSGSAGGQTVQNFHFGFHTDESTTLKHLDTVNGRKFLVNASRQTVREVNGKG